MSSPPPIRQIGIIEGVQLGLRRRLKPLSPSQLPSLGLRTFRQVSDDDLLELAAGWAPGTKQRLWCDTEIKRREGRTARLALAISVLSLAVTIFAQVLRPHS